MSKFLIKQEEKGVRHPLVPFNGIKEIDFLDMAFSISKNLHIKVFSNLNCIILGYLDGLKEIRPWAWFQEKSREASEKAKAWRR